MTTLVEHARTELGHLGVDREMAGALIAAVGAFASYEPLTHDREMLARMLWKLVRRLPLAPLTANPREWVDRSEISGSPLWQNLRDGRAFSEDAGRTYRLADGGELHRTAPPRGWMLALRERDGIGDREAEASIWEYLDAGEPDDADRDAMGVADPVEALRYARRRWGRRGAEVARLLHPMLFR